MRWVYSILGHLCLIVGAIGIFVPLLPTTPFLLLAALLYSKGSQRFHDWLLDHPRLGLVVKDWNGYGVIQRRAKVLATVFVAISLSIPLLLFEFHWVLKLLAAVCALAVLAFVLSRPSTVEQALRRAPGKRSQVESHDDEPTLSPNNSSR